MLRQGGRMDLTDTGTTATLIAGIVIVVGILGVVIPVIPGLILCWLGVLVWALLGDAGGAKWLILGLSTGIALAGTLIKYLWPGKRLKDSGVPTWSLVLGGILGVIGFFVVPVVGLVLGFVLGIWLAERARLGPGRAWPSTRHALGAIGLSLAIELAAALAIAVIWLVGVLNA
ncbi:membrane protein [Actinoplanes sp. NBRC 103695]|nr:membrane protein [Actinoplanes sp. NBRC 103695]